MISTTDRSIEAENVPHSVSLCALYGVTGSAETMESAYLEIVKWINEYGRSPDRVGVVGKGYSSKMTSYDVATRQLRKARFRGLDSFEMQCTQRGSHNKSQYLMTASVNLSDGYAYCGVDDSIQGREALARSNLMEFLIRSLRTGYGIGYSRTRSLGPEWYAVGVLSGDSSDRLDYEEGRRSCRWGDLAMPNQVFHCGLLRDVYPVNFLSPSQLSVRVEDTSLEKWIYEEPTRGVLTPVTQEVVRWDLEPKGIADVFEVLWRAGMIFDWERHEDVKLAR